MSNKVDVEGEMGGENIREKVEALVGGAINGPLRTEFPVASADDVLVRRDGDRVLVGYLSLDPEPRDFWAESDGLGELKPFTRAEDPNALLERLTAEGTPWLLVERYSHGLDHYSVANTRAYPDRQWDVGLYGVFIPCEEVRDMYRDRVKTDGEEDARAWLVEDTNGTLSEFSKCVNGEVYGVVLESWKITNGRPERTGTDAVWGHIGAEYAREALAERMPVRADLEPAL